MYARFSHNFFSISRLLRDPKDKVLAYVRKIFAQFPCRNALTYCVANVVLACVRKVFAQIMFRIFHTYCFEYMGLSLCAQGCRRISQSATSLLMISKTCFQIAYTRISHNFFSISRLLRDPKNKVLAYVRKVFAQFLLHKSLTQGSNK